MGVIDDGIAPPAGIVAGLSEGFLGLNGQAFGSNH
jgi:hypothetical protein